MVVWISHDGRDQRNATFKYHMAIERWTARIVYKNLMCLLTDDSNRMRNKKDR
jgi:hypothetical protein